MNSECPSLEIVIVNWNSGRQLSECIKSIEKSSKEGVNLAKITIVDNASEDESLSLLEPTPMPLQVIRLPVNAGFARACNIGAAGSSADYLLMLNPDTRLYPDSLSVPAEFMERQENRTIGICGIQLVNEQGDVTRSCARFPTFYSFFIAACGLDKISPFWFKHYIMNEWPHDVSRHVDHVIGAFYWIRRNLWVALDGFDGAYYVYLEDIDFSLRASRSGYGCAYLSNVSAFHKGGGTSEGVKNKRLAYSVKSRITYARKNLNRPAGYIAIIVFLVVEPLCRMGWSVLGLSWSRFVETTSGYFLVYKSLFFGK